MDLHTKRVQELRKTMDTSVLDYGTKFTDWLHVFLKKNCEKEMQLFAGMEITEKVCHFPRKSVEKIYLSTIISACPGPSS